MTPTTTDFRPIPEFPAYEINRQGTIRRGGKPLGRKNGSISLEQDGKKLGTTRRALMARIFGPDAVPAWRYHILTHPALKVHKGETNGNHRMTAIEVTDLREMYASGNWSHRQLAAAFNISASTVGQIVNHKTWKHLEKKDD